MSGGQDIYEATFTPDATNNEVGNVTVDASSYGDLAGNAGAGSNTVDFSGNTLAGGPGNDTITAGGTYGILTGRGGADNFVFDWATLANAEAATPIVDHIADYDQGNTGHFSAAEGDTIDISALTGGTWFNGFIHVVDEGPNGTFLVVDADGSTGGIKYIPLVQLDGIRAGDTLNVIVDSGQQSGITFGVESNQGYAGNFNGATDGISDLVFLNDANSVIKLYELNGNTSGPQILTSHSIAKLPTGYQIDGIGDFNNDGNSDLLLQSDTGVLHFWEMNGYQLLKNIHGPTLPAGWQVAGIGDFNGDGVSDVVIESDTGALKLWEFNGHASGPQLLHTPGLDRLPAGDHIVGVGDFNGDGISDLLLRNDSGLVQVWELNGASSGNQIMAKLNVSPLAGSWHIQGIGDFNNDGKSDILLENDNGTIRLWEMDGNHIANALGVGHLAADEHIIGTGDFNGDGISDILLHKDNGATNIMELNGAAGGSQLLHEEHVNTVSTDWATVNHHFFLE